MKERVFLTLLHPRGAADDDDRGFFRKRFSGGVCHFQPADTVRDTERPKPPHARIGISGETRPLLVGRVDCRNRAPLELLVKPKHIVPRNPENMAHPVRLKPLDQIFAHGGCALSSHARATQPLPLAGTTSSLYARGRHQGRVKLTSSLSSRVSPPWYRRMAR